MAHLELEPDTPNGGMKIANFRIKHELSGTNDKRVRVNILNETRKGQ